MKKLLSFTLLLAAITMTGGCLNQDKEESKEIVQMEKATRYVASYPSMYIKSYGIASSTNIKMQLENNYIWKAINVASSNGYFWFDVYGNGELTFGDSNSDGIATIGEYIALSKEKSYTVTFNELTKKYTMIPEQEGCYLRAYLPEGVSAISDMNYLKAEIYNSENKLISTAKFRESAKFGCPMIDTYLESGYNTIKVDALKAINGEKYAKRYIINCGKTITPENIVASGPTFGDLTVTVQKVYFTSSYSQMYIKGTFNNWQNTVTEYGVTRPSKMGLIANNVWCTEITTTAAGSFKFDRNGDWSENYGDNNNDKYGDRNGSNIAIPSAGVWKVTFNEISKQYTIEKLN